MSFKSLASCLLIFFCSASLAFASGQGKEAGKPGVMDAVVTTIEATVENVDQENRKVTLKGPDGNLVTIEVGDEVKNLPQVEKGDIVTVEYIEAVAVQLFPEGTAVPGLTAMEAEASAEPGQKPAGIVMGEVTIVATVEAIDLERQMVTLKGAEGRTKTFKARNPEMLGQAEVGDTVMITIVEAIGVSVTEK
jgi:hypothetical protein